MADRLHEAKVYSWASKTGLCAITWICLCFFGGSASGCCTGIEESWVWTGSGGLQLLGSIGKLAESHIGYTCGHNHFAVNRSWGKNLGDPQGFSRNPRNPPKTAHGSLSLCSDVITFMQTKKPPKPLDHEMNATTTYC